MRVLALCSLVVGLVASLGMPVASAEDDDHPVGYTIGIQTHGTGGNCNFYKVDLTTGETTRVNPVGQGVQCGDGLTFDDDGTLYAYTNESLAASGPAELVTIDLDDGQQHVVGALPPVVPGGGGMTFDAEGHLWLYALAFGDPQCTPVGSYCLWKVDPDDGSTTFVGVAPFGRGVFGLAADCEDVIAITANAENGPGSTVRLDEVHTSTGALEHLVDLPGVGFPSGLDFEDDGDLWAIGTSGLGGAGIGTTLWRINETHGTSQAKDLTSGGAPFNSSVFGLAVDSISCEDPGPEPAPVPTPVAVAVAPTFTG
jgi:hypothetical protein